MKLSVFLALCAVCMPALVLSRKIDKMTTVASPRRWRTIDSAASTTSSPPATLPAFLTVATSASTSTVATTSVGNETINRAAEEREADRRLATSCFDALLQNNWDTRDKCVPFHTTEVFSRKPKVQTEREIFRRQVFDDLLHEICSRNETKSSNLENHCEIFNMKIAFECSFAKMDSRFCDKAHTQIIRPEFAPKDKKEVKEIFGNVTVAAN